MDSLQLKVTKGDLLWSYLAHFLNMAAGIIILPYVLVKLPSAEMGLYYVMITISSLIALLDFGFTPQFARNISYIYGGAQSLSKEGVSSEKGDNINYNLLATMISVAKKVYSYLSLAVLVLMLSFGTLYIYKVTEGFQTINNSLIIWVIFSLSSFVNMYFTYYNSLLTGAGMIKEQRISVVVSKTLYIVLCVLFISQGWGLIGLCVANLFSPLLLAITSFKFYYTKELKAALINIDVSNEEKKRLFAIIWYNAKKLGIASVSAYGINKMGMFLAGLFLTLEEMSSYGLMVQLVGVIGALALMPFSISIPQLSAMQIEHDEREIITRFAFTINLMYVIFVVSSLLLICVVPFALKVLGSQTILPIWYIIAIYCVVMLLEHNHSSFATLIVTTNSVPFVIPSIVSGFFIVVFSYIILRFSNMGVLGLVLVQGIVQLAYNNWKWPKVILEKYSLTYPTFLSIGFSQTITHLRYMLHI